MRDAILYSCGANDRHGLRRTNEDKRRAVKKSLEDPEWSGWSSNKIAERFAGQKELKLYVPSPSNVLPTGEAAN